MFKQIVIMSELCTGCRRCELICSFVKEHSFNSTKARIRVLRKWPEADVVVVCHQCARAPCIEVCPVKALSKDAKTSAVIVDEEKCIGCGECVKACPFGAITLHPEKNVAVVCDLCNGDPACVKYCPTGALKFETINILANRKREVTAESVKSSITEHEPVKNLGGE